MRVILIVVLLLTVVLILSGCEQPAEPRTGNPVVYERIESHTDCMLLQQEFDTAEVHGEISYMEAANQRMMELACT